MKFSLAIPVYDDYDSLVCCTQANVWHNREHIAQVVVVDNNPNSAQGKATRDFCAGRGWVYHPYPDAVGTAAAKNKAVELCNTGNWVVCMDSHIILAPGFFEAFNREKSRTATNALYHGALIHDELQSRSTSLTDKWSSGMFGQWQFDKAHDDGLVFPIKNAACGLFIVHRDHWLGFNPRFRGFGGEEGYLQLKYSTNGRGVYCVPGCDWWHRFGRPEGVKYPLNNLDKFRNYLIGWAELGLPIEPVITHFVGDGMVTESDAQKLIKNDFEHLNPGCGSCGGAAAHTVTRVFGTTFADMVEIARVKDVDIVEHCARLESLGEQCEVIFDIGSRASSTLALASKSSALLHFGALTTVDVERINAVCPGATVLVGQRVSADTVPAPDLVFIDLDPHTYNQVTEQLNTYGAKSKRYIVLHDTESYPDVMRAVADWLRDNRRFTLVQKHKNNNGLVVLSCDPADKLTPPGTVRKALTFARALTSFALSGGQTVSEEKYQERLGECDVCQFRVDSKCGECGCPVDKKAAWSTEKCPVGRW